MQLPEYFIKHGLEKAVGKEYRGVLITGLTRDELIAALAVSQGHVESMCKCREGIKEV